VRIESFAHKGLKRLYTEDRRRGLPPECVGKLRLMLAFLQDMGDVEELLTPPRWKAHRLTGDRDGTWSLHVTRNWRLTFRVDRAGAIRDVDLEDYH
jgi:proteic killer suppression protein